MAMHKFILILLLPFLAINVFAKQYPKIDFLLSGNALMAYKEGSINFPVALPNVNPDRLNNSDRVTSYQNTIELLLKNQSAFHTNAKVTVSANLKYYPINVSSPPVSKTISLEINNRIDTLTKSVISSIYAFKNAFKVELAITNVVVTSDAGTDLTQLKTKLADFIELNIGFQEERLTRINYNTFPTGLTACEDQATDELVINWNSVPDAEKYELEYTFADDYTDNYSVPVNPLNIPFNFKDNSTRVSLKETYYRFPLVFERGYLLYRVRAIGRGGNNLESPVYCRWSGAEKGKIFTFANKFYHGNAHSADKMNWQAASTFAEDGKRSDLVGYMDGTFRSRQTVTGINLEPQLPNNQLLFESSDCFQPGSVKEREVIAGETIYDYQGRPAVNILPVPTNSKKLEYLPLLNISNNVNAPNTTRKPYNWQDFDKPNFTCPNTNKLFPQPDATTGIMGAAAYYSTNNPNKLGFNAFIPDAGGFPFTQQSYLQDNTGRVAAQSGVGTAFQFVNNHETRFYYAAPNQEELDRMFGTEVGDALRYKKNAVIDPNGQVSVAYINPEGKTIATALAGKAPDNLDPLANQTTNTIDISLMSKNVMNPVDKTLVMEHQFVVTTDNTDYIFDYAINPETLTAELCTGFPVCLDCIYDIDLTLNHTESCSGTPLASYSGTIGDLLNSSGKTDLNCNNSSTTGSYPRHIVKTLGIGTYTITKKIKVNRQAALAYIAEVLRDTCKSQWNAILHDELSRVDTMNCYRSCANCAQPPVKTATCDTTYCMPNPNRCDNIKSMMLADISPGGQYAQFTRNVNGTIDASTYPLSIFNSGNILPALPTLAQINLALSPSSFASYSDLVNNWLPEYAEKLLPMHPEHCLLGWCSSDQIDATLDFDSQLLSTQFLGDAVTKGYFTPGSPLPNSNVKPYEQLLNKDPWFLNNANPAIKNALLNKLKNYGCSATIPADEFAMQMAWCARNYPPPNQQGSTPAMNPTAPPCILPATYLSTHGFGTDPNVADLEWIFLRSLYLSAKNEAIQSSQNSYADANNCNSRCIGAKDYNGWAQFSWNVPNFASQHNFQPCQSSVNPFVWLLYKDKQNRFGTSLDNILNVMADAGISMDVSSVTNYDDPCQYAQAIANQAGSINQQVANTLCGGASDSIGTTSCEFASNLTEMISNIIRKLKDNRSVIITKEQLPVSISSAGITVINGSYSSDTTLCIAFRPCPTIYIPYLKTNTGYAGPLSVCCISSISCPGNTNCSFDLQILYPNNETRIIHVNTKCNFLSGCKETGKPVCSQPSPYVAAVNEYLDNIFQFETAYNLFPAPIQLKNQAPVLLQGASGTELLSATLNTAGNFAINLTYNDPRGKERNCSIFLQMNPDIGNWSNIKNIINIAPDLALAQNGITRDFILKVLSGTSLSNLATVLVKGHVDCWAMNQCPPVRTLCDSIPVLPPYPTVNNCVRDLLATANSNTSNRYGSWVDSMKTDLLQLYYTKCLKALEVFNMKYDDKQYHYNLYYYDQAGNLVKTVPPAGVKLLDHNQALQVQISRQAGYTSANLPAHFKTTVYRFNTLNEAIWQKTPDAGESRFFYDGLGRVVASQNAQQKLEGDFFSYTRYDLLGRMVESGKLKSGAVNSAFTRNFNGWINFINGLSTRTEITLSQYDDPYLPAIAQKFGTAGQRNLRKRIASVLSFETVAKLTNKEYFHATHYTYDIEGNVYQLIQDYPNGIIGDKTMEYDYDLQSGKVNQITYQRGFMDQFIHNYSYDAANRLTQVKTSANGVVWETDAEYKYYRHGPLARMELGTDKVQGLDYMYTLQGWIKGVNGTSDTTKTDMGQDGIIAPTTPGTAQTAPQIFTVGGIPIYMYNVGMLFGNGFNGPGYGAINNPVARDAFGYVIDYYPSDYTAIQGNTCLDGLQPSAGTVKPLYNGNISRMYTQIKSLGNNGYNYTYDQLNRITSQHAWKISGGSMSMLQNDAYGGTFGYDADGNILNKVQNGTAATQAMDNLDYFYYDAANGIYNPATSIPANATNRLAQVKDQVPAGNYTVDIDTQNSNNYAYDQIGNLISDAAENITQIEWNLQNKITQVAKSNGPNLRFQYDALGNRVMKDVTGGTATQNAKTFYVRDAQGKALATYAYKIPATGGTTPKLFWSEADIYGSNRIGLYAPDTVITVAPVNATDNANLTVSRGFKQYELTNHLGNVLATITDRKIPSTTSGAITYQAEILSGQDYYAFGMLMPGRGFSHKTYRFGFGNQEKDDEIIGEGNSYTAEYWQYDPLLGRRWNIDPITKSWESSYAAFSNNPICFNDPSGLSSDPPVSGPNDDCDVNNPDDVKYVDWWFEQPKSTPVAENKISMTYHNEIDLYLEIFSMIGEGLRWTDEHIKGNEIDKPPVKTNFHGDMPLSDSDTKNNLMSGNVDNFDKTGIIPGSIIGGAQPRWGENKAETIKGFADAIDKFAEGIGLSVSTSKDQVPPQIKTPSLLVVPEEHGYINFKQNTSTGYTSGSISFSSKEYKELLFKQYSEDKNYRSVSIEYSK
jgi:YD repeat-containing protein